MDFRFSTFADPSTYDNEGLCNTPMRLHQSGELEERGIIQAQRDWREHVGPLDFYRCTMGRWNYMTCTLPECLPDRLEIISYANEISFIYDDLVDTAGKQEKLSTGTIAYNSAGKRMLQAKILKGMLKIDRPRALVAMEAWAEYLESSGRNHHKQFDGLDDFLEHRARDAGEKFVFAIVTFGMGLIIGKEEHETLHEMCRPCFAHLTLVNDLYSYEEESEAAVANGDPGWLNALNVIMREHSVNVDEAKLICSRQIKKAASEFSAVITGAKDRDDLSLGLRRYLEALQYGMTGNLAWSMTCPRYHNNIPYTGRQLALMRDGAINLGDKDRAAAPSVSHKRKRGEDEPKMDMASKERPCLPTPSDSADGKTGNMAIGLDEVLASQVLPALDASIVDNPMTYIGSLPSRNVKGKIIDALNVWFKVPRKTVATLKRLVGLLHAYSLMLDDMEDSSSLRRGMPSVHPIYGHAQTINSAGYGTYQALAEVATLGNPCCVQIFIEEMRNAYIGQSWNLHWTANIVCSTFPEYLRMIDDKTGGLFRLLARMMAAESKCPSKPDVTRLVILVGRYFQIRDDYQNLNGAD
ncbi:Uu.00g033080.m01.CDS01, partial [Anthostomella pinea]